MEASQNVGAKYEGNEEQVRRVFADIIDEHRKIVAEHQQTKNATTQNGNSMGSQILNGS